MIFISVMSTLAQRIFKYFNIVNAGRGHALKLGFFSHRKKTQQSTPWSLTKVLNIQQLADIILLSDTETPNHEKKLGLTAVFWICFC